MPRPLTRAGKRAISLLAVALLSAAALGAQQLVVSAPNHQARLPEVIEIPLAEARQRVPDIDHRIAENALNHEKLVTQVYTSPGSDAPDKLLIAVQLPASGQLTIDFVPSNNSAPPPPLVFGREAPERKDDFAWENQFVTYRVYGPALEATGEIASGIDVWSKRVPNFV